jgi:glycosyltransferase involved in cell wall biosynthesis
MLKEAVDSVLNQKHTDLRCIIYDDGSDSFDIIEWVKQYDDDRIAIAVGEKMDPEERVRPGNTQWPTNINKIISMIPREEFLLYLCDDDVLDPNWFEAINERYTLDPKTHLLLGDMYYFQDGDDPLTQSELGFPAKLVPEQNIKENDDGQRLIMWWNLGAFAHSMKCFYDEDVRWRDGFKGYAHSWDIQYIEALQEAHGAYVFLPIPSVYRREHKNTMSAKLGRINEEGLYFRAGEELTTDAITSPME